MKKRTVVSMVGFVSAVGLWACQDQAVVAPDDGVLSPTGLELVAKKGGKANPWTKDVDFLLGFNQPYGAFPPSPWDVVTYDDMTLHVTAHNESFEASLTLTAATAAGSPGGGSVGDCYYDPVDVPNDVIEALAQELDGARIDPWEPDPYLFPHNIVSVDRTALGAEGGSEDSRIQFGYSSPNPVLEVWDKKKKRMVPGTVAIRVGGVQRFERWGQPTVELDDVGDAEHFTFTGGTVSVIYYEGRPKPRLDCPLADVVKVSVKKE